MRQVTFTEEFKFREGDKVKQLTKIWQREKTKSLNSPIQIQIP